MTRFLEFVSRPTPVRVVAQRRMRWLIDAIIAFVICMAGLLVAGVVSGLMPMLADMAYPTALPIGLLPAAMWMHYCGVGRGSTHDNIALAVGLMALYAFRNGVAGLWLLPASLLILAIALPAEWIVGKVVLSWLPGSSSGFWHSSRLRV